MLLKISSTSSKGPPSFYFLFCNWMDVQKIPNGPLLHFSALCHLPETFKKFGKFFSFGNCKRERILYTLKSFCCFWASDMAPTWAVSGAVLLSKNFKISLKGCSCKKWFPNIFGKIPCSQKSVTHEERQPHNKPFSIFEVFGSVNAFSEPKWSFWFFQHYATLT